MSIEELEAEALKLDARARARLAGKLLECLDELADADADQLWADEAARRDRDMDSQSGRLADDVFKDARSRLN